jgi:hypothetical protein
VLYLDGKRVWGSKTFKGKGIFMGFKLGGGKYKQFTFDKPPVEGIVGEDGLDIEEGNLSDEKEKEREKRDPQ